MAVSQIDPASGGLVGTYSYTTYESGGPRGSGPYPALPAPTVDAHSARVRWPTEPYGGTGPLPPFAVFEIVIP